jgi:type IV secretion system protein VirB5
MEHLEKIKGGILSMKKVLKGSLLALCLMATNGHTAVVVIDPAILAQSIQQVVYWAQQLEQMKNQLNQQISHYKSITGSRNLGTILNDPQLQQFVPKDAVDIYNSIKSGDLSKLSKEAQAIRNANKIYDCEGRTEKDYQLCQATLVKNAQDLAYAQNAYKLATQKIQQIQSLIAKINDTQDPKAIAELQARIQGETTAVANEQNRLTIWRTMSQAQDQANNQQVREKELKNLSLPNSASETFQYHLPQ